MQHGLEESDLKTMTNLIYYLLYHVLNIFLEKMINIKYFGDKTVHLLNSIYILYKGGNTTRLLIHCFIKSIDQQIQNKNDPKIANLLENLYSIIKKSNIGDWDYNIKINYNKLKQNGFHDKEFVVLAKLIVQIFYYISTDIKDKFKLLLRSKINIENISKTIQTSLFGEETTKFVNDFVQTYNNSTIKKPTEHINSLKISKVIIFDQEITQNNNRTLGTDEYRKLNKESYVLYNTDKIVKNRGKQYTLNTYVNMDDPFVEKKLKELMPGTIPTDNIYISYLDNISFARRYGIASFNLLRIKINNLVKFVADISVGGEKYTLDKKLDANFELVDISVPNVYDNKSTIIYQYYYHDPTNAELVSYEIINPAFEKDKIFIPIPSAYTMFADIAYMLFSDNIFAWDDQKYEKRIRRLLLLILPCLYQEKYQTANIIKIFEVIKPLFVHLTSLPTIRERLSMFDGHYTVIDNPLNDKIKEIMDYSVTDNFRCLNIVHKLVKINDSSPYSQKYLEYIIENYIRMLIIANYVINNIVSPGNEKLVQYELQMHRILELPNVHDYLSPLISTTLTRSLTDIYMDLRGTSHNLPKNKLVPIGPLTNLPASDDSKVSEFFEKIIKYETTLIENCDFMMEILVGLRQANIFQVNTIYRGESLF